MSLSSEGQKIESIPKVLEGVNDSFHSTQHEEMYYVVKNVEEQYSIWPTSKEIPIGWVREGERQEKSKCLDYIKKVWVDMRPLSLREEMKKINV